jgi:hypothetical protein
VTRFGCYGPDPGAKGVDMLLRHEVVAEVLSSGTEFRRHSIYRSLRRMSGREPAWPTSIWKALVTVACGYGLNMSGEVAVGDLLSIYWSDTRAGPTKFLRERTMLR